MLVYSIASRQSFHHIASLWTRIHAALDNADFPVIIVGNHCVSKDREQEVGNDELRSFGIHLLCPFLEVDCKDGINVDYAFNLLVARLESANKEKISIKEKMPTLEGEGRAQFMIEQKEAGRMREGQKLRAIESHVEREIAEKRLELRKKEKELRELEARVLAANHDNSRPHTPSISDRSIEGGNYEEGGEEESSQSHRDKRPKHGAFRPQQWDSMPSSSLPSSGATKKYSSGRVKRKIDPAKQNEPLDWGVSDMIFEPRRAASDEAQPWGYVRLQWIAT